MSKVVYVVAYKSSEKEIKNMILSVSAILIIIFIGSIISISFEIEGSSAQKIMTNTSNTYGKKQQTQIVKICGAASDQLPERSGNEDANRLLNKGFDYAQIGKYQQAIQYYDMALDKDPNFANALNNKGVALFKLGKYEESIQYYDMALYFNLN